MNTTRKITGNDAIRLAERDSLTIHCHANPTDDGGVVAPEVARQIVREDAGLVYVTVTPRGWWDGKGVSDAPPAGINVADYFNSAGMYLGPDDDGVEPTWDDAADTEAAVAAHVASLSAEARADIRAGRWDEIMTDALYAATGATTQDEMANARKFAETAAR